MKIAFSESFKRAFRKKVRNNTALEELFWSKAEVFLENPFHSQLKTHKLTAQLKDL